MPVSELSVYWGSQVYDHVPNTHRKGNGREVPGSKAPYQREGQEEEVKLEPCVQVGGELAGGKRLVSMEKGRPSKARKCGQSLVSPGWAGRAGMTES